MTNKIDLHMHSNISNDGECTPTELIEMCRQSGLETAAISDHNSVRGIEEARGAAKRAGIEYISAIELDCHYVGTNLHVLGYGIDPQVAEFTVIEKDILRQEQDASAVIMQCIADMGILIEEQKAWELAVDGVVTAEMIAEVALEDTRNRSNTLLAPYRKGGSRSDNPYVNFYWDFCSQGKPAAVQFEYMDLQHAVSLIKRSGGLTVLAHPGINIGHNQQMLSEIISFGIDGIEVYSSYHDEASTTFFSQKAEELHVLKTMGSDSHGKIKPAIRLGMMECAEEADITRRFMRRLHDLTK